MKISHGYRLYKYKLTSLDDWQFLKWHDSFYNSCVLCTQYQNIVIFAFKHI